MDRSTLNQFSDTFYNSLVLVNNKVIGITNSNFMPDYGTYLVVPRKHSLGSCYKITATSLYPTIRPNCTLSEGRYCYEVRIMETKGDIQIGFAEQGFIAQNKKYVGAGMSDSWAISGAHRDGDWKKDDVIVCCIDIDHRLISYYVNGKAIKRKHEAINTDEKLIFPVISLHMGDSVEIRFNKNMFKYQAPTDYDEIDFMDYNVFQSTSQEVLNCKYALLYNEKRYRIKAEHILNDDNNYIYTLGDIDINNIQFVIPFNREMNRLHIYVQLKDSLDFVVFKSFEIKQKHMHMEEYGEIQYLLDVLRVYKSKIESADDFWKQIGFNVHEWNEQRINIIKKEFYHLLYYNYVQTVSLLSRLSNELQIAQFKGLYQVFSTKFKYSSYSLFNYCAYAIDVDTIEDDSPFLKCTYKLIGIEKEDNKEYEVDDEVVYKYNDEITMSSDTPLYASYKIMIFNENLFQLNHYIELQRFEAPVFDISRYEFYGSLHITDDRFITLNCKNGHFGEYDEYQKSRVLHNYYRITSKSVFPTIRVNCNLTKGQYYYAVTIVESTHDWILLGFANTKFKASHTLCVGDDSNSWSCSGAQLWHNKGQISADYGSRRFEKGDYITCWIDCEKKHIRYDLNGTDLGIAFENITFDVSTPIFPCISMKGGQIIDIEIDKAIKFEDKTNVFVREFKMDTIKQILNSKYTIICDAKHYQIKECNLSNVYTFNTLSDMRFLVPFKQNMETVSLFVQNRKESPFVLFKMFDVDANHERNKLNYLYNILLSWKGKAQDCDVFSNRIGFDVKPLIATMIQNNDKYNLFTFCEGYDSTKRILHRLYEEFGVEILCNPYRLLSTKFEMIHMHRAFNYCSYKLQIHQDDDNDDEKSSIFKDCHYTLDRIRNPGMRNETKTSNVLRFDDGFEFIIRCNDPFDEYVIWINLEFNLNKEERIELQRWSKPDFSLCSDAFCHHLGMVHEKSIQLMEAKGDYGRYDITKTKAANTYIVDSKSQFCCIRANCALSSGKYYYEVCIRETDEDCAGFYIGWADQDFVPNDEESYGVGIDCSKHNSWACNGMETWHNGKQNETFNVNTCICGVRLELFEAQACYPSGNVGCVKCKSISKRLDHVWHCSNKSIKHGQGARGYDLCVDCSKHEGYWQKDDVIGCGIDIDNGEIVYYLNNHSVGVAFGDVQFKKKQLFPAISMFNNQSVELIFNDFKYDSMERKGYKPVPHPELYTMDHVDEDHYDGILQCKFVLRCATDERYDSAQHDIMYQFDDMNELQFIIPYRAHTWRYPMLKLYVESPHHRDLVLLKTFNTRNIKPYCDMRPEKYPELQYLLSLLAVYDRTITNPKDFFNKIGEDSDYSATCFKWNYEWMSVLSTARYKSILETKTPLNGTILHRLIHELQLEYMDGAFKVLDTRFIVKTYPIFGYFTMKMNDNMNGYNDDVVLSNGVYTLVEITEHGNKQIRQRFKYNDFIAHRMNPQHSTYVIYINNRELFHLEQEMELQKIEIAEYATDTLLFGHNSDKLQIQNNAIVLREHKTSLSHLEQAKEAILNVRFGLICNEDKQQVHALHHKKESTMYQFDDIERIQFAIPKVKSHDVDKISIYIQFEADDEFILMKTFDYVFMNTESESKETNEEQQSIDDDNRDDIENQDNVGIADRNMEQNATYQTLLKMGFEDKICSDAIKQCNNDVNICINYVISHENEESVQINDDLIMKNENQDETANKAEDNEQELQDVVDNEQNATHYRTLLKMGFEKAICLESVEQCKDDLNACIDYAVSHQNEESVETIVDETEKKTEETDNGEYKETKQQRDVHPNDIKQHPTYTALLSMGFDESLLENAMNKYNNDLDSCIEHIMYQNEPQMQIFDSSGNED